MGRRFIEQGRPAAAAVARKERESTRGRGFGIFNLIPASTHVSYPYIISWHTPGLKETRPPISPFSGGKKILLPVFQTVFCLIFFVGDTIMVALLFCGRANFDQLRSSSSSPLFFLLPASYPSLLMGDWGNVDNRIVEVREGFAKLGMFKILPNNHEAEFQHFFLSIVNIFNRLVIFFLSKLGVAVDADFFRQPPATFLDAAMCVAFAFSFCHLLFSSLFFDTIFAGGGKKQRHRRASLPESIID